MQQKGTGKSCLLFTPMSPGSNFLSSAARMTKSLRSKTDQGAPLAHLPNVSKGFSQLLSPGAPDLIASLYTLWIFASDFQPRLLSLSSATLSLSLSLCRSCEFCALVWGGFVLG